MSNYTKSDIAVLLVDLQPYHTQFLRKEDKIKLINSTTDALNYFHKEGIMVVNVATQGYTQAYASIDKLLNKIGAERHIKDSPDAFDGTCDGGESLKEKLQRKEKKKIVVIGLFSSECVYSTADGGINNGFEASTIGELIEDAEGTKIHTEKGLNISLEQYFENNDICFYKTFEDFIGSLD